MRGKPFLLAIAILAVISGTAAAQPALDITSHHDGQTVKDGTLLLRGTASDPAGVQSVAVSINAEPWQYATGNTSGSEPLNWAMQLKLREGANIIIVNATSYDNISTDQTIIMDYSVGTTDNSGVLLAGAIIIVTIVLVALAAVKVKRAPPPEEKADEETIEKRLDKIAPKEEISPEKEDEGGQEDKEKKDSGGDKGKEEEDSGGQGP